MDLLLIGQVRAYVPANHGGSANVRCAEVLGAARTAREWIPAADLWPLENHRSPLTEKHLELINVFQTLLTATHNKNILSHNLGHTYWSVCN